MATIQRRFGSFDFGAGTASGVLVGSWDDQIVSGAESEDRNDGLGRIRTRSTISGRQISLEGEVTGSGDADTVRANLGAFVAAFRNREDYLRLFSTRRILCGLASPIDISYPKGMQFARAFWKLTLESRWPTWESVTASADTIAHSGTSSTNAMPANAGDAEAYPVFTITNTGTSFSGLQLTLNNLSTSRQFRVDGLELNNGQSITIDFRERTIGDGISIPTMVSGVSAVPWELSPLSTQTLQVVTSAAADLDIDISFRSQFWSA